MNLKKNEYDQKSKQAEIDKLSQATQNTEVRSEIDGVIQKIDTSKMGGDDSEGVEDTLTEGTTDSTDSQFRKQLRQCIYHAPEYRCLSCKGNGKRNKP